MFLFLDILRRYASFFREFSIIFWYLCIACLMTWPLVLFLPTHIIGTTTSDAPLFLWNAWELQRQLHAGHLAATTQSILFPRGGLLLFHTYTPVLSLFVACVNLVVQNIVLAFNIVFLSASVFSGYVMYRLTCAWTDMRLPAVFAGQLFAFQPLWSVYAGFGTMNMLIVFWMPLAVLCIERYARSQKMSYVFFAATVSALALYNDPYQGSFCFGVVIVYVLLRAFYIDKKQLDIKSVMFFCFSFLVLSAPYFLLFIYTKKYPLALPTIDQVQYYAADPINFFRPFYQHPVLGQFSTVFTRKAVSNGNAFLGFTGILVTTMLLCITLFVRASVRIAEKKELYMWASGVCIFVCIALGPFIQIAGVQTRIPGVYWYVSHFFPQLFILRVPMRWLIPAGFFVAGFVAAFLAIVFNRIRSPWVRVVVFVVFSISFVFDQAFLPRSVLPVYVPQNAIIADIPQQPAGSSLLELPASIDSGYWSVGDVQNHMAMLHQVLHEESIVTGHMSRLPAADEQVYRTTPVIQYLLQFQSQKPTERDYNPLYIRAWLNDTQLRVIVIRKNEIPLEKQIEVEQYIQSFLGFEFSAENEWYSIYTKPAM